MLNGGYVKSCFYLKKLLMASAIASAPASWACDPYIENLKVAEYDGQEQMPVGTINTQTGILTNVSFGGNFLISSVQVNGVTLCGGKGNPCQNRVRLAPHGLGETDVVVAIFTSSPFAATAQTLVYVRSHALEDRGSVCKPLYPSPQAK
jgi:hypothetical protein